MQSTELSPELADAADVLSDQLRSQLQRLSEVLAPSVDSLDRRFRARLKELKLDKVHQNALSAITLGAAAQVLSSGQPTLRFIEQVEYHGRRLAKLNVPPTAIIAALQEYDEMLGVRLHELLPGEEGNLRWVREQLHFCVILTLNNAYYQVREAETQAFYELFRVELESRSLEELLDRFLGTLSQSCSADAACLYLLSESGQEWRPSASLPAQRTLRPLPNRTALQAGLGQPKFLACRTTDAALLLDASWKKKYETCWSIPLSNSGKTVGVMQFGFKRYYEWLPREQELLAAAAERCLMAAEKARLMEHLSQNEEQIRQLAEHMLHVEEMERRRISRELHDEAGQSLLCIRLQMELLEESLPESEKETRQKLSEARDLTERTILEIRRLIAALSPAVLEQLGLGAALRQLISRFQRLQSGIVVKLVIGKVPPLAQQTEIIVYRLVQECFNNIGKHSKASRVNISVSIADGMLKLIVVDNGVGFNVDEAFARRDSFGLSGMRERVTLLGGRFQIRSNTQGAKKDRGTRILIELPISKRKSDESNKEERRAQNQLRFGKARMS